MELALHEAGDGLLEGGDAVIGITAVLRPVDLGGHDAAQGRRGHFVVLADAEVDQLPLRMIGQRLPLRPLDLLELVDLGTFAVVRPADAVGEEFLEIGIGHGGSSSKRAELQNLHCTFARQSGNGRGRGVASRPAKTQELSNSGFRAVRQARANPRHSGIGVVRYPHWLLGSQYRPSCRGGLMVRTILCFALVAFIETSRGWGGLSLSSAEAPAFIPPAVPLVVHDPYFSIGRPATSSRNRGRGIGRARFLAFAAWAHRRKAVSLHVSPSSCSIHPCSKWD